jgi:DNA-binding NtrC family response regulator
MPKKPCILIVDDERNIRITLQETLAPLGAEIDLAADGREALEAVRLRPADVILLDLKMPEMGGMEFLRSLEEVSPQSRVIIITAHGSVEDAVTATKLGAIDFIQKPFSGAEIRSLVQHVLERERLDPGHAADYASHVALAKRFITDRNFTAAKEHAKRAIAEDPSRPEAFNLLGVLEEVSGRRPEGIRQYRVALDLDPTYVPAQQNLARATRPVSERRGPIAFE